MHSVGPIPVHAVDAGRYQSASLREFLDVAVHIGLTVLLVAGCLIILWPFIPLLLWAVIISIASYPGFRKMQNAVGGRRGLAAVLWTILLLTALVIPLVLLMHAAIQGFRPLAAHLLDGSLTIPPPPPKLAGWPIVGMRLTQLWSMASSNLGELLTRFGSQIKAVLAAILSTSRGITFAILQCLVSIVVAGALLAHAEGAADVARSLADRLFGHHGPDFQYLIGATIRSVTIGILGVALVQSVFAALGFFIGGLPGAGVWSAIFLGAAVLQLGGLVLIPAAIYMFAIASTIKAVAFLIWCLVVGVLDNALKPVLLGRGVSVPTVVVFVGAIGGFLALGIIGLFIGPVVLCIGYKLFVSWLHGSATTSVSP